MNDDKYSPRWDGPRSESIKHLENLIERPLTDNERLLAKIMWNMGAEWATSDAAQSARAAADAHQASILANQFHNEQVMAAMERTYLRFFRTKDEAIAHQKEMSTDLPLVVIEGPENPSDSDLCWAVVDEATAQEFRN